ncbi:MAG: class I SAM-dependent methyltransferase [Bacteroidales bacterium]|jgi:predicted O-methyltransferase YrrM|nr:class I SAM-dependent methyltransferase [Bacteroidales bacterium]MBR6278091.1 class I SAM-dependent methyltransferase [Bacteroidales bacterium]
MWNIDEYIENHTTEEDQVLSWLRRKTYLTTTMPRQLSGRVQGKLLEMFSRMINPENILEIGTFTGYSAYCLTKGLKAGGKLHTIEVKDELEDHLNDFFSRAGILDKVVLHIGDGAQIVKEFSDSMFDMVFIDGDKRQYPEYYENVFPKVKIGGYILIDNVLWYDKVISEVKNNDPYTLGIIKLNDMVQADNRVENVLVPIRDGLTLARKISD